MNRDIADTDAPRWSVSAQVGVTLDPVVMERLLRTCRREGLSPAAFCGRAVERALRAVEGRGRRRGAAIAEPPLREALIGTLKLIVAEALARSNSWAAFERALGEQDLAYATAPGGLELRRRSNGARLAAASEVGPSYAALVAKYGSGLRNAPALEPARPPQRRRRDLVADDRDPLEDDEDALIDFG